MINYNHSVSNYAILVEEFNTSILEYSNVFSNGVTIGINKSWGAFSAAM